METFSKRIRKLRAEKNKTLQQIADDLGITKATISRYENGAREPRADILPKLSRYFNVSIDYLLGEANEPHGHIVRPDDIDSPELKKQLQHVINTIDNGYIEVVDEAREKGIDPDDLRQLIDILYKQKENK